MAVLADDRIDGLSVGESSSGAWVVLGLQGVCECIKQLGQEFVRIHLDVRCRLFSQRMAIRVCGSLWIGSTTGQFVQIGRERVQLIPFRAVINILLGDSEGEGAASRVVCAREKRERERESRKG